ncbi:hypothetical protein SASPL_130252 [Salvia splendens]|uniref:O-fucosyltransferase family protein n=1 Tax=Salvia splendens TaxID=180675 RepID=A0A8X8X8L5_SALSN|nr:O-fucosyltransferase 8-like [Salvia splendens]KAG6407266.1 hypothetical protein SASPL_130252 [Salvia splendens]
MGGKQGPRPNSLSFDASSGLKDHMLVKGFKNDYAKFSAYGKGAYAGKRHAWWPRRHVRSVVFIFALLGFFFLLDSFMYSYFDPTFLKNGPTPAYAPKDLNAENEENERGPVMYSRLVQLASFSLAKIDQEQNLTEFWKETHPEASTWKPCADRNQKRDAKNTTGFILVSANGGLNQQRVAVCNAVAVASLLNATLVIPRFLYSNVWKDPSQFSDIYQEETFMNMLKDDVDIVKELPPHLRSTDFEAIGSLVTDADVSKEATPDEYVRNISPILSRNGVVHFLGFGNRLGFESVPSHLQKLRCKCNFHALKFVPKIQKLAALLVKRITKYEASRSLLDRQLLGSFIPAEHVEAANPSKYLALHLRFEVDMVAYSMCDFGGGEGERTQLQAYREEHFPLLLERLKKAKQPSPEELRKMGRCPLTPEEATLVLASLGFDRGTYIYLAGSQIYGGESRMLPLVSLYPNLVTKEDLLSPTELEPFSNFSSQLAALDFIACGVSDVFAITDSGSQLSSLVSGFRTYYGGGDAPTLRPSKKRLAAILQENSTISWPSFEKRVRKMIKEGQRVRLRRPGRSIYRQPRCRDCMCSDGSVVDQ